MKRALAILAVALAALIAPAAEPEDWARYVDPFIGTDGHGHTFPGATLPFGMVQLSPDTRLTGWDGCSGYHYSDRVVYGFSHTHLSGTGASDYGDILLMPMTGKPTLQNGSENGPDTGYASRFSKDHEFAKAGWYAVRLDDYGIDVELTATERVGYHRYRFPEGKPGHVIVDLKHRDAVLESALTVHGDREISGLRRSSMWARDQVVYFVARFSRPFTETERNDLGAVLSFGDGGGEVEVRVGISAVDVDGARRNLEAEGKPGFDEVKQQAREQWNRSLNKIRVEGGTEKERRIFYTALYHSLIAPNVFSDVDGRYRGMDFKIHQAEGRRQYTVFSLWDTFRATHPLFTLIETERTLEFIETMLAMYQQGGRLPVWELAANETDTMIGYHSVSVIVDAWVKGIRGFDEELALEAMIDSATRDHFGLESYRRQGFIGGEDEVASVSQTLEYAYDDYCIATFAEGIGESEIAQEYALRSQGWRHLLDPETGFMRPRVNQSWLAPFDPHRVDQHFTEANSWQYSFFVPHDVESLIEEQGGDEAFTARLDDLFTADSATTGLRQPDISGLIGQYAHGNEPSHATAWLYHYAGRPDRSFERVHEIVETLYDDTPEGLSGNEDCGQLSSWYLFAAMGLYPVCPGSPDYVIGVPVFDAVTLQLDGARSFTIRRTGKFDPDGPAYVRRARLNGRLYESSAISHDRIAAGGALELQVGSSASAKWGTQQEHRPASRVEGKRILAAPTMRTESDRFVEQTTVELETPTAGATVHYRLGEAKEWQQYSEPLTLTESSTIRFQARAEGQVSPTVESYLHRLPNDWKVELTYEPAPRYRAGGSQSLIDGLSGADNWRMGGWHGFEGTDFEATVDFGRVRTIEQATANFLQDVRSWIWMPREVVFSVSSDGTAFHEVGRFPADVGDREEGVILKRFTAEFASTEARYVRVTATNYGECPSWHPGSGDPGFIFVDELSAE